MTAVYLGVAVAILAVGAIAFWVIVIVNADRPVSDSWLTHTYRSKR